MKALIALCFTACAPLDGLTDTINLRGLGERAGTAIRLNDGRLVAVQVVKLQAGAWAARCGHWTAPDTIIITDDPYHCKSVEMTLAHELGHAYGKEHGAGVMAEFIEDSYDDDLTVVLMERVR